MQAESLIALSASSNLTGILARGRALALRSIRGLSQELALTEFALRRQSVRGFDHRAGISQPRTVS
jgi:hypothetical protein